MRVGVDGGVELVIDDGDIDEDGKATVTTSISMLHTHNKNGDQMNERANVTSK
jgi:agmatine/peptidylarginine deiminase